MEVISETPEYGSLKEALLKIFGEEVSITDRRAVHGGDANEAYRLFLSNGETLFLKANSKEREDFFRAEAECIAALRSTGAIRVPRIYAMGKDEDYSFLLMEYIDSSRPIEDFWEKLGTDLAMMHKADTIAFVKAGRYGFDKRFYDSYFESMGMIPGYADRRDLYNLYHLLNHLNLFGSSYLYAVVRIIDKYV